MRKTTANQFKKAFDKLTDALRPGQAVQIIKKGKPHGLFVKTPQKVRRPNFLANLRDSKYSAETGERLFQAAHDPIF